MLCHLLSSVNSEVYVYPAGVGISCSEGKDHGCPTFLELLHCARCRLRIVRYKRHGAWLQEVLALAWRVGMNNLQNDLCNNRDLNFADIVIEV